MGTGLWAFAALDWKTKGAGGAIALAFLSLAACDGAPSAAPARGHAANGGADRRLTDSAPAGEGGAARYSDAAYGSGEAPRREADTPLYHGKPVWAANKRHSAQDNVDYHFKRDGDAVGATSADDFVAKVHAFVDSPPKGTEVLTRTNGDRLIYDPKANLFAAADKDGVPRTLFKPRDGAAYWAQQKDSVAKGEDFPTERRRTAKRTSGDDNG